MKTRPAIVWLLVWAFSLESVGLAQLPAVPAIPAAPGVGSAAGVPTIWNKLGFQGGARLKRLFQSLINRRGNFPGLEGKPLVKSLTDPANMKSDNPAVKAAAQAKADADGAAQKVKAIKYLATVGCDKCIPGIKEALLAALDDCTEEVRYEAAKAARTVAGDKCSECGKSCCEKDFTDRLFKTAYGRDEKGCYVESSGRVRKMARQALLACCTPGQPGPPPELPTEGPAQPETPEAPEPPEQEMAQNGPVPVPGDDVKQSLAEAVSDTPLVKLAQRMVGEEQPIRHAMVEVESRPLAKPGVQLAMAWSRAEPPAARHLPPAPIPHPDDQEQPLVVPTPGEPTVIKSKLEIPLQVADEPQVAAAPQVPTARPAVAAQPVASRKPIVVVAEAYADEAVDWDWEQPEQSEQKPQTNHKVAGKQAFKQDAQIQLAAHQPDGDGAIYPAWQVDPQRLRARRQLEAQSRQQVVAPKSHPAGSSSAAEGALNRLTRPFTSIFRGAQELPDEEFFLPSQRHQRTMRSRPLIDPNLRNNNLSRTGPTPHPTPAQPQPQPIAKPEPSQVARQRNPAADQTQKHTPKPAKIRKLLSQPQVADGEDEDAPLPKTNVLPNALKLFSNTPTLSKSPVSAAKAGKPETKVVYPSDPNPPKPASVVATPKQGETFHAPSKPETKIKTVENSSPPQRPFALNVFRFPSEDGQLPAPPEPTGVKALSTPPETNALVKLGGQEDQTASQIRTQLSSSAVQYVPKDVPFAPLPKKLAPPAAPKVPVAAPRLSVPAEKKTQPSTEMSLKATAPKLSPAAPQIAPAAQPRKPLPAPPLPTPPAQSPSKPAPQSRKLDPSEGPKLDLFQPTRPKALDAPLPKGLSPEAPKPKAAERKAPRQSQAVPPRKPAAELARLDAPSPRQIPAPSHRNSARFQDATSRQSTIRLRAPIERDRATTQRRGSQAAKRTPAPAHAAHVTIDDAVRPAIAVEQAEPGVPSRGWVRPVVPGASQVELILEPGSQPDVGTRYQVFRQQGAQRLYLGDLEVSAINGFQVFARPLGWLPLNELHEGDLVSHLPAGSGGGR